MIDQPDRIMPVVRTNRNDDFSHQLTNPDNNVWELIFDSMPEMIALIDLKNIVVKANKAMRQKVNVGDQGLTGHLCNKLMHMDGCSISNCPHLNMIIDQKPHSVEMYEPKFGLYLNITTTPIFDANNNLLGSLHISRDISLQKESEARLMKYNNELKDLNQSKDKFFGIVAHDLRSPFQGMLGFTDLILDEIETLSKAEIKEYLQKVRDSSYSTFTLLENLLDWSRLQTGRLEYKPSEFSLSEDISAVMSLLNSNAQNKNIRLTNNLDQNYFINADRRMVHSILLNLTTNAIKFTHPGGAISFDAKINSRCDTDSEIEDLSCNHKVIEISVSDNGVGISAENLQKIINIDDHYSLTGTSNEQGAGLGLILVKEMTEKQGGKLTIQSEEGKGSVFSFTLPYVEK